MQALDDVKIICYAINIFVPQSLRIHVLDWYNFYINHSSGSRLAKKPERYVIGKALPRKHNVLLKSTIYVNSSEIERLFMEIYHLRILQN